MPSAKKDLRNTIRIARQYRKEGTFRPALAQPFHCDLQTLSCNAQKKCNTLLWNPSLGCSSSNAQSISIHAKHNSTASTKKRKSHLEPSVPLRAQNEQESTAKRRCLSPSRARANFSPQRNLRLPGRTPCFVQILSFKWHPWCSASSKKICQQSLARHDQDRKTVLKRRYLSTSVGATIPLRSADTE